MSGFRVHLYKLLLVLSSCCCAGSVVAELNLISADAGVFERLEASSEQDAILISGRVETIRPTNKVVAKIGTKFGIRFRVSGKKEAGNLVTLLYLTPGIVDLGGLRHDKYLQTKDLPASAGDHTMAFQIVEPNELVPGIWQMMVFEKDRLLVKETFEVIIKGTETLSEFQ